MKKSVYLIAYVSNGESKRWVQTYISKKLAIKDCRDFNKWNPSLNFTVIKVN